MAWHNLSVATLADCLMLDEAFYNIHLRENYQYQHVAHAQLALKPEIDSEAYHGNRRQMSQAFIFVKLIDIWRQCASFISMPTEPQYPTAHRQYFDSIGHHISHPIIKIEKSASALLPYNYKEYNKHMF